MSIAVCIPIYNDWQSALLLLERLDAAAGHLQDDTDVLFVDDGSTEAVPRRIATPPQALRRVQVLRLRRNLGHQRAIAVALTFLYERDACSHVVVMDGDGEDDPVHIAALLERS